MINLSDWHAIPSDQPIILEGEQVQDFCDVLDRLFEKSESNKKHYAELRKAIRIIGQPVGRDAKFGPFFMRSWEPEYAVGAPQ